MNNDNNVNLIPDMPEGFAMALSQNMYAMQYFSSLPQAGMAELIERARGIGSKEEMQGLVDGMIKH